MTTDPRAKLPARLIVFVIIAVAAAVAGIAWGFHRGGALGINAVILGLLVLAATAWYVRLLRRGMSR